MSNCFFFLQIKEICYWVTKLFAIFHLKFSAKMDVKEWEREGRREQLLYSIVLIFTISESCLSREVLHLESDVYMYTMYTHFDPISLFHLLASSFYLSFFHPFFHGSDFLFVKPSMGLLNALPIDHNQYSMHAVYLESVQILLNRMFCLKLIPL